MLLVKVPPESRTNSPAADAAVEDTESFIVGTWCLALGTFTWYLYSWCFSICFRLCLGVDTLLYYYKLKQNIIMCLLVMRDAAVVVVRC